MKDNLYILNFVSSIRNDFYIDIEYLAKIVNEFSNKNISDDYKLLKNSLLLDEVKNIIG